MGKRYKNSPILEAICEFRFPSEVPWDLTTPGSFYDKIKNTFPIKEQHTTQSVEISESQSGIQHQLKIDQRMFFYTNDKKTFVQIGNQVLGINCLKPYPSWDKFKPFIESPYKALKELIELKSPTRIGLRYINKIEVPKTNGDLSNYFEFRPLMGSNLPQNLEKFNVGCYLPFSDARDYCRIRLSSATPDKSDNNAYLLDLDYILDKKSAILPENVIEWVDHAHDETEKVFEGCITDQLREIFEEAS